MHSEAKALERAIPVLQVYLLYWYKKYLLTSAKVRILTQRALERAIPVLQVYLFTCFTSTKVLAY